MQCYSFVPRTDLFRSRLVSEAVSLSGDLTMGKGGRVRGLGRGLFTQTSTGRTDRQSDRSKKIGRAWGGDSFSVDDYFWVVRLTSLPSIPQGL